MVPRHTHRHTQQTCASVRLAASAFTSSPTSASSILQRTSPSCAGCRAIYDEGHTAHTQPKEPPTQDLPRKPIPPREQRCSQKTCVSVRLAASTFANSETRTLLSVRKSCARRAVNHPAMYCGIQPCLDRKALADMCQSVIGLKRLRKFRSACVANVVTAEVKLRVGQRKTRRRGNAGHGCT